MTLGLVCCLLGHILESDTPCYYLRIILLFSDPYEVIRLFPELLPQQSRGHQELEQRPKLQDRDLENGLLALIEFLTEVLKHVPSSFCVYKSVLNIWPCVIPASANLITFFYNQYNYILCLEFGFMRLQLNLRRVEMFYAIYIGTSGNASDFCLGNAWFQSRLEHQLTLLGFIMVFLFPLVNARIVSWNWPCPLLPNCFH